LSHRSINKCWDLVKAELRGLAVISQSSVCVWICQPDGFVRGGEGTFRNRQFLSEDELAHSHAVSGGKGRQRACRNKNLGTPIA
jgi:hypothetical protein